MGYTHYYSLKEKTQTRELQELYNKAIRQCARIAKNYNSELKKEDPKHIGRLSGYTVHTKTGHYLGLNVNGTKEYSHETFSFPENYSKFDDFCKTARKPYDTVVVACLITLKYYLGDLLQVESDGNSKDWEEGLLLAKKVLRIKNLVIPSTIERRLELINTKKGA